MKGLSRVALLPFGLALVLFAGTLWNKFVFDDVHQVLNNPWIRDFQHLPEIFSSHAWAFAGKESNYYRPLMHLTNAALYVIFGPVPWVFHLLNVLLHGAVTTAFFVLVFRILRKSDTGTREMHGRAALLAAFVFVMIESMTWNVSSTHPVST